MFVLILVDLVGLLRLGVNSLSLLTLCSAELLQLLLTVKHCTHHDLTGHCESCWIHLSEYNGFLLTWLDLNVIAGALLRLLDLKLLELRVVDVLTIACLHLVIYNVDITVTLFSHGEVLCNFGGTLFSEVCGLTLSEFLLSTASHELAYQLILVVLAFLVTKEDRLSLTVAAH